MAKFGGMLNAICAKLLKTTNHADVTDTTAADTPSDQGEKEGNAADVENNNAPNFKDSVINDKTEQQNHTEWGELLCPVQAVTNGSHRKNRRKKQIPRNLTQLHAAEETDKSGVRDFEVALKCAQVIHVPACANADISNRDVLGDYSIPAPEETSNMNKQDTSRDSLSWVRIETSTAEEYAMDLNGALDLSLSTGSRRTESPSLNSSNSLPSKMWDPGVAPELINSKERESGDVFADTNANSHSVRTSFLTSVGSVTSHNHTAPPTSSDAADMKNYAQELLGLYGLGKQEALSITESVSLENFSSGSILARQVPPGGAKKVSTTITRPEETAEAGRRQPEPGGVSRSIPGQEAKGATTSAASADEAVKPFYIPQGSVLQSPLNDVLLARSAAAQLKLPMPIGKGGFNTLSASSSFGTKSKADQAIGGINSVLGDYSKYVKRFATYEDCKDHLCREFSYKEHFHCIVCNFKLFTKKDEMIRHFKWHKKREESLQHGFLRFSTGDDCSEKFENCSHNGKQTHYHCDQAGCNKVYVSTSDVQMHSNYHKKDMAIFQEGFQRFRATEDCGETSCSFHGQRTTHFHCRRTTCRFTFKNKADMEKHKAYHQKDEALAKDGFKKFMKYEPCNYTNCKYSKAANHIHCIRPGCDYVLHSTGQLFSHKRKHERRDIEHAYKRFKEEQKNKANSKTTAPSASLEAPEVSSDLLAILSQTAQNPLHITPKENNPEFIDMDELSSFSTNDSENMSLRGETTNRTEFVDLSKQPSDHQQLAQQITDPVLPSTMARLASKLTGGSSGLDDSLNLPIPSYSTEQDEAQDLSLGKEELVGSHGGIPTSVPGFVPTVSPPINNKREKDETWKKYLTRYTANDPCHPRCSFLYKDHYHCNNGGCGMIFRSKDGVREHGRYHEQQDRITSLSFKTIEDLEPCSRCPNGSSARHYHCLWAACNTVISKDDLPFARLEHHKIHEYARAAANKSSRPFNLFKMQTDAFRRRRGRPPKYPKNDIPVVPKIDMTDDDIQGALANMPSQSTLLNGFFEFCEGRPCPDEKCYYFLKKHYHCVRPRCHHATDRPDVLNLHAKDFHNFIKIREGFEFFDRNVNCRRTHCHNNRVNKHYHCMRPRCDYSFVRHSTMAQHDRKHQAEDTNHNAHRDVALSTSEAIISSKPRVEAVTQIAADGIPLNVTTDGIRGTTMVSPLQSPVTLTPPPGHNAHHPGTNNKETSVVKTKGTYFPMPGLSPHAVTAVNAAVAAYNANMKNTSVQPSSSNSLVTSSASLISIAPKIVTSPTASGSSEAMPLTMLLQQKGQPSVPQLSWSAMKMKMHYDVLQSCGRPFCKLKKKDHYHCFDCNQAFSEPVRLRSHVTKHGLKVDKFETVHQPMVNPSLLANPALKIPPPTQPPLGETTMSSRVGNSTVKPEDAMNYRATVSKDDDDEFDEDEEDPSMSSSLNLNPSTFSNMLNKNAKFNMGEGSADPAVKQESLGSAVNLSGAQEKMKDVVPIDCSVNQNHSAEATQILTDEDAKEADTNFQGADILTDENLSDKHEAIDNKVEDLDAQDRRSGRKRSAPKRADFIDSEEAFNKQRKLDMQERRNSASPPKSRSSPRAKVVEQSLESKRKAKGKTHRPSVVSNNIASEAAAGTSTNTVPDSDPEGFRRFQFGEKCGVPKCSHRLSGSHWHCTEENCLYGFNDRSRAAAHAQKHAQVKAMLGEDFLHYNAKSDCNREGCEHVMSAAHFHCKNCEFTTTITSKVQVHRRQHNREDYITEQGFVQYSGLTSCQADWCTYSTKQTHYHCTVENCRHSTVAPAQMRAHKSKKHEIHDE